MATWEQTIQNWGNTLIGGYANSRYVQPYEVEKLRLQALGQAGFYTEGQPGVMPENQNQGVNGTLLLIGGAVLVFMLLSRD